MQADATARLATSDPAQQQALMAEVTALLAGCDRALSPPEIAATMYRLIAEQSGVADPYATLKRQGNELARAMEKQARERIQATNDPLLAAVQYAMAGNIIDYGAHHDFDANGILTVCLNRTPAINDYEKLQQELAATRTVLYLADNCGELVFDGLLIEQLGREVTVAIKERPIINDALAADAIACGIDRRCRIISNGTDCPGTPLANVSADFRRFFDQADLVISKGQGNLETLSECSRSLYFLLTVKCGVVARYLATRTARPVAIGDAILLKHQGAAA